MQKKSYQFRTSNKFNTIFVSISTHKHTLSREETHKHTTATTTKIPANSENTVQEKEEEEEGDENETKRKEIGKEYHIRKYTTIRGKLENTQKWTEEKPPLLLLC